MSDLKLFDSLLATVPFLSEMLKGVERNHLDVLRRNTALHADGQGFVSAPASATELCGVQRGPRVEQRLADARQDGGVVPQAVEERRGA